MTTSNIVKLCTAALAGSIIGILYERNYDVKADSPIVPRDKRSLPEITPLFGKQQQIESLTVAENFKHSAKFGLPSGDNLRIFNDFIMSYDRRLRSPVWVIEHLTPEKLVEENRKAHRENSSFHEDSEIHEYFRAKNSDFHSSGFDRGHMAAAGNHKVRQEDMDQTFVLSNISPQRPELNRGAWERLETYVRWRAKRGKNLYVVSGPLYLPLKARDGNLYVTYQVLGNNHISVPTHYFKVFLVEENNGKLSLEAFLMPNDPKMDGQNVKLDDYRIPIERLDVIERASGVIFFDRLPRSKIDAPLALQEGFKERRNSDKRQSRT